MSDDDVKVSSTPVAPEPIKLREIKRLCSVPTSCIKSQEDELRIPMQPKFVQSLSLGIRSQLNSMLQKYTGRLNGIPIGYDDVKILSSCGYLYDSCPISYVPIRCTFFIFSVGVDDIVQGVVVKRTASRLGCLVYGMFYVAVHLSNNQKDSQYDPGDTLMIRITCAYVHTSPPHIDAVIEQESHSISINEHMSFEENDLTHSGKKSKKKKKDANALSVEKVPELKDKSNEKKSKKSKEDLHSLFVDGIIKIKQEKCEEIASTKKKHKKQKSGDSFDKFTQDSHSSSFNGLKEEGKEEYGEISSTKKKHKKKKSGDSFDKYTQDLRSSSFNGLNKEDEEEYGEISPTKKKRTKKHSMDISDKVTQDLHSSSFNGFNEEEETVYGEISPTKKKHKNKKKFSLANVKIEKNL